MTVYNEKRLGNQPVPRKFILSYTTLFLYSALTDIEKFIQKKEKKKKGGLCTYGTTQAWLPFVYMLIKLY